MSTKNQKPRIRTRMRLEAFICLCQYRSCVRTTKTYTFFNCRSLISFLRSIAISIENKARKHKQKLVRKIHGHFKREPRLC